MNSHDQFNFGGNREKAILRDKERCVKCGMTRAEHKAKYGRDISVDHKVSRGVFDKKSAVPNNNLTNLQTLCVYCHGRKDMQRTIHYQNFRAKIKGHALKPIEDLDIIDEIELHMEDMDWTQSDLARLTGISPFHISEYLGRQRPLPLSFIRAYHKVNPELPLEHLIKVYKYAHWIRKERTR